MWQTLETFALFGGYGLLVGLVSAGIARRVGRYRLTVAAAGALMVIAWGVFWAALAARGCGSGCVVDVTPAVLLVPLQLLAFAVGATAAAFAVSRPRPPRWIWPLLILPIAALSLRSAPLTVLIAATVTIVVYVLRPRGG
jgi:hypothetical protein